MNLNVPFVRLSAGNSGHFKNKRFFPENILQSQMGKQ
jgi:hypothetical protein